MTDTNIKILLRVKKLGGRCNDDEFLRGIICGECPVYTELPDENSVIHRLPHEFCVDAAARLLQDVPAEKLLEDLL